jgi:3-phenylpropionate/trans-cinnamate dioxygenase ferredoxin component
VTDSTTSTTHTICRADELPSGASRIVEVDGRKVGLFNANGQLYAIEDRCSHDDGPLAEGPFDPDQCTVECPRHGSLFDLTSGRPKTLPAYLPVDTFPVRVDDGVIKLEID